MSAAVQVVTLQTTNTIVVSTPGMQGVPGPAGASGSAGSDPGRVVVPFAYGDATPQPVFTAPAAGTDLLVRLVVDTPFNGAGATLQLGTTSNPGLLMPANYNDPTTAATYEAAPDATLASGEQIVLTITPGAGATQGAGRIIFDSII